MHKEITIIGPGLIGASLGLALKRKKICKKIIGIDTSKQNLREAYSIKAIDEKREKIDKRIKKSSVIFICTPVSLINKIIYELSDYTEKNQIISDVGSVKNIFERKTLKFNNKKFSLVPGHPIAGTEHSGAKNAFNNLFRDKWCILTPISNNKKPIRIISEIWKGVGMKVATMKVNEHDKIMSITSHLPHLIAFTIVGTAFNLNIKKKNELINFAAGGFKDFTRIGSSDPKMWTDIFLKNKEFLKDTLSLFLKDIDKIKKLIEDEKYSQIFRLLKRTKEIRNSIIKKRI